MTRHALLPQVAIVGEGESAAFLRERLAAVCRPVLRGWEDISRDDPVLWVVVDERPEEADLYREEETLRGFGKPWLRVALSRNEGTFGPWVRPGRPGCSLCANTRRLTANAMRIAPWPALPEDGVTLSPEESRNREATSSWARRQVLELAAAEVKRFLQGRPLRSEGRLHLLSLPSLRSSLHTVLPDPLCPVCGELPDDSAERAVVRLTSAIKRYPGHYRLQPLSHWRVVLQRQAFDLRTGAINGRFHDVRAPVASTSVSVPSFVWGGEIAGGRGRSYAASETAAMLEGMERYCSRAPQGKKTVVHDSYNRLKDDALDPRTAGLYAEEQYRQPDFPYEPFDPDEPIDWVWGYNLTREKPILVPLSLAYYSASGGENWVAEGSNGSAIGGCWEEAVLHGLFEAVERDAFLIAWYARLPLRQLDPHSAGDPELSLLLHRIRCVSGYDVRLYDMTMEHGIPGILAIAKTLRPGRMNLVCAAGAHLNPLQAARGAVQEAAGLIEGLQDIFEREKERLERMFRDSSPVERMEDHVLLYGLPQAEERLSFLLKPERPLLAFGEAYGRRDERPDLADDVRELVRVFGGLGLEVVAVDQTSPEVGRLGLRCVKTLVPGLLPMTFGSRLARLAGLRRVLEVPFELGFASRPLDIESLHRYPHPFP